jgi:hypothetical protein
MSHTHTALHPSVVAAGSLQRPALADLSQYKPNSVDEEEGIVITEEME